MGRLLDVGDDELENLLLHAGRDVAMSAELQDKTLMVAGVAGTTLVVAAASHSGKLAWLSGKGWPLVLSATGVASITALSWLLPSPAHEEAPPSHSISTKPLLRSTQAVPPPIPDLENSAPIEAAPTLVLPKTPDVDSEVSQTTEKQRPKSPTLTTPKKSSLKVELAYLSRASAALSEGQPHLALQRISAYRKRFAHPKLGLEAEIISIEAYAQNGQGKAARLRARRFSKRHPKSPLLVRLKKYL